MLAGSEKPCIYSVPIKKHSYELCEALDVSRGTFYNHIFRRADRSKYADEQTQLMKQVQQIFDDSSQRYGAGKNRISLAENGIHTSRKRISTIMQELDLRSVRTDSVQETAEIPVMSRVPEYDEPRLSNIYVEKRGSFRGLSVPS